MVVSAGVEPAAAIGGGFRRALCQLSYDTVDSCLNCTGDAGAIPVAGPAQPFLRKGLWLERRFLCGTEEGGYALLMMIMLPVSTTFFEIFCGFLGSAMVGV